MHITSLQAGQSDGIVPSAPGADQSSRDRAPNPLEALVISVAKDRIAQSQPSPPSELQMPPFEQPSPSGSPAGNSPTVFHLHDQTHDHADTMSESHRSDTSSDNPTPFSYSPQHPPGPQPGLLTQFAYPPGPQPGLLTQFAYPPGPQPGLLTQFAYPPGPQPGFFNPFAPLGPQPGFFNPFPPPGPQPGFFNPFAPLGPQPGFFNPFAPLGPQPGLFTQSFEDSLAQTRPPTSIAESSKDSGPGNAEDSGPGKAKKRRRKVQASSSLTEEPAQNGVKVTLFKCVNCSPPKIFQTSRLFARHCRERHSKEKIKCCFEDCERTYFRSCHQALHVEETHLYPDAYCCGGRDNQPCKDNYRTGHLPIMRQHYLGQHLDVHNMQTQRDMWVKDLIEEHKTKNPDNPKSYQYTYTCTIRSTPHLDLSSNQSHPENKS